MTTPADARLVLMKYPALIREDDEERLRQVEQAIYTAADQIKRIVESSPSHDVGRLLAALDRLSEIQWIVAQSLLLPRAVKK